jgi:hypothetical protein
LNVNKITALLNDYLNHSQPKGKIEVIIELTRIDTEAMRDADTPRNAKIATMKDAFQKELQPVQEAILDAGGDVVDCAWINQTVKARIPAANIYTLVNLDAVTAIDLPRKLMAE